MEPNKIFTQQERQTFVLSVLNHGYSVSELAKRYGISRQTGHFWLRRYQQSGQEGLRTRSRQPSRQARQLAEPFVKQLMALRRKNPTWGPKKLMVLLSKAHGHRPCSIRTLGRWLQRLQFSRRTKHRAKVAHWLPRHQLTLASKPNEVWTLDFKGWFRTEDGKRWDPLTVKDLYSRMALAVYLLPNQEQEPVRRHMHRLFSKHGLPRVIRVDNGSPFASRGPLGLTALSLGWRRLGIQVEFTRRSAPQDNASHEQFHRVYKAEVLGKPAANGRIVQQRTNRWLSRYNHRRPHESLDQKVPAQFYRSSSRKFRPIKKQPSYPPLGKRFALPKKDTFAGKDAFGSSAKWSEV